MATHSSILTWEVSWTEEPGRLQSKGQQRVRHDLATTTKNCYLYIIYNFICNIYKFISNFLFYIELYLIYNVVLVSDVWQNDSVRHIHSLQILFPYKLLQKTEQFPVLYSSSLFYISNAHMLIPNFCNFSLLLPPFPFVNHKFVFNIYESVSVL